MTGTTIPKIRFLVSQTSREWVYQALTNMDIILLDHSHCERKAAQVALSLMFRYPASTELVRKLTAIAREELEHFELVNQILERRGIPLAPMKAPPYGEGLKSQVRRREPGRMLDSLLVSSLIEARSHERFGLLSIHLSDRELAQFYHNLMASEARHYGIYWTLATTYFDRERALARLQELAIVESQLLATLHPEPRIHG